MMAGKLLFHRPVGAAAMRIEECSFRNPQGGRLVGRLLLPRAETRVAAAVFAHGFGSSKDSRRNRAIAERLVAAGLGALLFDFTGHGESQGRQEESTLEQQTDDVGAALDFLTTHRKVRGDRVGVAGSSSGGSVAICRAAIDGRVKALVLREPRSQGLEGEARTIGCPTLIIQGDQTVEVLEESRQLYTWLATEKKFCLVEGASHLFAEPECFATAVQETVNWFVEKLPGRKDVDVA